MLLAYRWKLVVFHAEQRVWSRVSQTIFVSFPAAPHSCTQSTENSSSVSQTHHRCLSSSRELAWELGIDRDNYYGISWPAKMGRRWWWGVSQKETEKENRGEGQAARRAGDTPPSESGGSGCGPASRNRGHRPPPPSSLHSPAPEPPASLSHSSD